MIDIEKIRVQVEKAAAAWLKDHENVEVNVRNILTRHLETIVKVAIGFKKNRWNDDWEIDTHHQAPPMLKQILEAAKTHAQRITKELMLDEVSFTEVEMAKFQALYKAQLSSQVKYQLEDMAKGAALRLLNDITNQEFSLDNTDGKIKSRVSGLSEEKKLQILQIIEAE